jgi:NitT/TauT family transport system substrate-binding protein
MRPVSRKASAFRLRRAPFRAGWLVACAVALPALPASAETLRVAQYVALERRDTDGMVADISSAFDMEQNGKARILVRFGDLVKDFHIHVIFAIEKAIASRSASLRAFLKGWFATIAFMRKNKPETVAIAADVMGKDQAIISRTYDELMPMYSDDGKFNPRALAVLAQSYVALGVLAAEPDMTKLYTEAFLPNKE